MILENWMLILMTSVVCGAVAALIAKAKGRPPINWFLIGFALNLVGLCIALAIKRRIEAHQ